MRRCVVVEESELIGSILGALLTERDWELSVSTHAEKALDLIRASGADLVLLDWELPSLGALDVLAGIAPMTDDERPHVIILMTECDPKQINLAREAGVTDYLKKPIDNEELMRAVERSFLSREENAA
ncbi:MAG: response regulator [Pseudomonadota bacterium]